MSRYESMLHVHNTTEQDHGRYKCVANNELGHDSLIIALDATSQYSLAPLHVDFVLKLSSFGTDVDRNKS